ncbi:MAG: hypothetical protein HY403_06910 [Elusimicrobia bacterium]|nr:hypothetical protein [Elusimicrobiota bacterium]
MTRTFAVSFALILGASAPAAASAVDLRVSNSPMGSWIEVLDPGLGIQLNSRPGVDGRMDFYGRVGGKPFAFESRPVSGNDPSFGHMLRSAQVLVQVRRFGSEFLIDGRVGSRRVDLRVSPERGDAYVVVDRGFGRLLEAWIPRSFAQFQGAFMPEKLDLETLAVLGAGVGLLLPL